VRFQLVLTCILAAGAVAQQGRLEFNAVKREAVEARLQRMSRGNAERQLALRQMFEEAGCKEDRLTEQT
jgi:hypothetical protein